MTNPALYPFSTPDGKSIPFEVITPIAAKFLDFLSNTSSTLKDLPVGSPIYILFATADCWVRFGSTIPNPPVEDTNYDELFFIPAGSFINAYTEKTQFSVRGFNAAGVLVIQGVQKWTFLTLDSIASRR